MGERSVLGAASVAAWRNASVVKARQAELISAPIPLSSKGIDAVPRILLAEDDPDVPFND